MMNRDDLIEVFQDTMEWCKTEELQSVIAHSMEDMTISGDADGLKIGKSFRR